MARFDTTTDRLKGVVATTTHAGLPKVHGERSASFEASIESLNDFRTMSADLIDLRRLEAYKEAFAYVENVVEEDDPAVIDAVLTAVWEQSDPENHSLDVDIAWWDDIREDGDDRVVTHYRVPREVRREATPAELRSRSLALTWQSLRVALLKRFPSESPAGRFSKNLRFYDASDEELGSCEVRDLLIAEPVVDGVQYVLSEGEVFRVTTEYLTNLDAFLESFVVSPCRLPAYFGGGEGRYNQDAGLVHLDQRLVTVDGSRLEICDLVDTEGRLIFVKVRKRASVMSHLWAQIVSSALLLRHSAEARQAAHAKLAAAGAPASLLKAIQSGANNLTVVLAILGASSVRDMTLLARIPLRAAVQRLQDLGYTVEIDLVPGPGQIVPPREDGA